MAKKKHEFKIYKLYPYRGYCPILDEVNEELSSMTPSAIEKATGVTAETIRRWRRKQTRRPTFATMEASLRGVGKTFKIGKL